MACDQHVEPSNKSQTRGSTLYIHSPNRPHGAFCICNGVVRKRQSHDDQFAMQGLCYGRLRRCRRRCRRRLLSCVGSDSLRRCRVEGKRRSRCCGKPQYYQLGSPTLIGITKFTLYWDYSWRCLICATRYYKYKKSTPYICIILKRPYQLYSTNYNFDPKLWKCWNLRRHSGQQIINHTNTEMSQMIAHSDHNGAEILLTSSPQVNRDTSYFFIKSCLPLRPNYVGVWDCWELGHSLHEAPDSAD